MDVQQAAAQTQAAYESEAEHQRRMYGPSAETANYPSLKFGGTSGPLTPAAPINDRIREMSGEVANAADVLAQRRQEEVIASRELGEAEARFADLSAQLSKLLEECRAMGGGNTLKATR